MSDVDIELDRAVRNDDLASVKKLLSAGASANISFINTEDCGCEWQTLLHVTRNVKIANELLFHGADVNGSNNYRESVLNSAIKRWKSLGFHKVLLKNGADVNAPDRHGNSPLILAVKGRRGLACIKELLLFGAGINDRNCYGESPLCNVVEDLEVLKLLVKINLLKRPSEDYQNIIDWDNFKKRRHCDAIKCYLEECACEIKQMKTDIINENISLYKFVCTKNNSLKMLLTAKKLSREDIMAKYPIYQDIIQDKVKLYSNLLLTLTEIQVCVSITYVQNDRNKTVVLNSNCVFMLAEYFKINDLWNFITAFYKHKGEFFDYSEDLLETLDQNENEDGDLSGICVKRARYD